MKKRTIWTIAVIMGLSFLALLLLQLNYIEEMAEMKREQFDESVNRALYQASRNMELNETLRYLERDVDEKESQGASKQGGRSGRSKAGYSSFQMKTVTNKPSQTPKAMILRNDSSSISATKKSLQEIVRNRYVYQKSMLDEVVYNILYSASEKPLKERVNFKLLDQDLKAEMMNNGINIPYHFVVQTQDGREVYRCPDYTDEGVESSFSQVLFRNDPPNRRGIVRIHFPEMNSYIFSSVRFMIPSVIFTFVLLVTFIFTIVVIFRQKRYSEIKNDFINNMTHEFKTPISTISLAAQMLNDDTMRKSPTMMQHISTVINDETKRLRFQVEKVLQMSMFDRQKATLKLQEVNANQLIQNIVNTFKLKVEKYGGRIDARLDAEIADVKVDEMHFTNVIFNLLDNAVKYRRDDCPLQLTVATRSLPGDKIEISIADNGIGIKRDDLKKVFEKFYRVSTGNRHDVKGFGLGLAYVHKMVTELKGEIRVESEFNKGSKFIITLPLINE